MKLSEAIKHGITLRPRVGALGERFSHVEGRGLCSDIWGAAIEAVMPTVAEFNWNPLNVFAFVRAMDAFREIQKFYFGEYFDPSKMPLRCPGARQNFMQVGGRVIQRFGKPDQLKTYDDYAKVRNLGGITTECAKVTHLAGMVDHLYHKHRVSAEHIANCVEEYENALSLGVARQIVINRNFNHYQLTGG